MTEGIFSGVPVVGGEHSISHEVVDYGEFVLNLIGCLCIYLGVLALPVGLV